MKNFDVQVVSKDIINGKPLASCVVTHDNQFIATVKYDYFSGALEAEFLNLKCIPREEQTVPGLKRLDNQIKLSVLQCISSESRCAVNRMLNIVDSIER